MQNINKFEIIKKYIDEYDYWELLACHAPNDEFDSYSKQLSEMITEKDSVEDIAKMIATIMDKSFGEEINPKKFITTAGKIKKALYAQG